MPGTGRVTKINTSDFTASAMHIRFSAASMLMLCLLCKRFIWAFEGNRKQVTYMQEKTGDQYEKSGPSAGGVARAGKLTGERRSEIARKAAAARWEGEENAAVCGSPDHPLNIGGIEVEAYVLEDGTRVLTQQSFMEAIGRNPRGGGTVSAELKHLPPFFQSKAIQPYLTDELKDAAQPVQFRTPNGARARGYKAELLPAVCDVYLAARNDGVLPSNQSAVARQAEILVRGLARVGIIALVDEATGYQKVRAAKALGQILEAFIDKELNAWVKTFPEQFYEQLFRLRGLSFPTTTVKRPQYFGHLTNNIVYKRLAPGVLTELKKQQDKDGQGRAKHKLFQRLTDNVGYPKLREHLGSVVTLMKLSDSWDDFMVKLDAIHPLSEPDQLEDDQPGL